MTTLGAVDVRNVDLDVGDSALEPRETLAHLLLDPRIAPGVALDLVVGIDLDEHVTLSTRTLFAHPMPAAATRSRRHAKSLAAGADAG